MKSKKDKRKLKKTTHEQVLNKLDLFARFGSFADHLTFRKIKKVYLDHKTEADKSEQNARNRYEGLAKTHYKDHCGLSKYFNENTNSPKPKNEAKKGKNRGMDLER